jgi:hypothetical protein
MKSPRLGEDGTKGRHLYVPAAYSYGFARASPFLAYEYTAHQPPTH